MSSFSYLDSLLKSELESFVTKGGESGAENPFFLSGEKIVKELDEPMPEGFDLSEFEELCERFGLDTFERKVVLLLFAAEADPKYGRVFAYLQDNMEKCYPTVHLVASLFGKDGKEYKDILGYFRDENSPLLLFGLSEIRQLPNTPFFASPLSLSDSVLTYLLGKSRHDETLRSFYTVTPPDSSLEADASLLKKIELMREKREPLMVNLFGEDEEQKRLAALGIASKFGFGLGTLELDRVPEERKNRSLIKSLLRDALLDGTLLYIRGAGSITDDESPFARELSDALETLSWLTFVSTPHEWAPHSMKGPFLLRHKVERSAERTREAWRAALSVLEKREVADSLALRLSEHFDFTERQIGQIGKALALERQISGSVDETEVVRLCTEWAKRNIHSSARRLETGLTFEDIVLPQERKKLLKEAVSHYRHQFTVFEKWGFDRHFQSRGVSLLFSGPSGTGKTMAASVIANELGLELYRIELPSVISKYIGETEKSLAKIFDTAEKSGVVLFFDEADAIFGKRSEIKDAHDRFANIEVSYLLQRVESYNGMVILATNFRKNIDEAFMRRMRFIIDFPLPGESEREEIWKKILSGGSVPMEEIEFRLLAQRFKLSGAGIRNAALYAAFKAADSGGKISMAHILEGVKEEMLKNGKSVREKDFEPKGNGRG